MGFTGSINMTSRLCVGSAIALCSLLALVIPAAAVSPASDPVAERGLKATTEDEGVVADAIRHANLLLAEGPIRLRAAWAASVDGAQGGTVPVYLVAASDTAPSSPAVVPSGCACVFVNPALLSSWAAAHSQGAGRLDLDREALLTFMLLHEAGHLSKGTTGGTIEQGNLTQLNIEPALAKRSEEDADEFAVTLLRDYFRRVPATSASLEANAVVNELLKLSWNMQAYRTLDEFAASATGKQSVYFDNGYTHPNLAWRILRSNYLIHQNEATKMLLDEFEAARKRGTKVAPVFDSRQPSQSPKQ